MMGGVPTLLRRVVIAIGCFAFVYILFYSAVSLNYRVQSVTVWTNSSDSGGQRTLSTENLAESDIQTKRSNSNKSSQSSLSVNDTLKRILKVSFQQKNTTILSIKTENTKESKGSQSNNQEQPTTNGEPPLVQDVYEPGFRIANNNSCPDRGKSLKVVILITTAPGHGKHRTAIRQTWGSVALRKDVALLFFVGRTDQETQNRLDIEQREYGDLVQGNSLDTYENLTLKSVSMLEWLQKHCCDVKIILKTDDDMFINTGNLLTFVDIHRNKQRSIYGRLAKRWKPIRNTKSKYFIDVKTYSGQYLPDFLTGPAYVFTGDLIGDLHQTALTGRYLKLEDVYITGVVGDKVRVRRVNAPEFTNQRIKTDTCKYLTSISVHMVRFEEQFDIWKRISDGLARCPTGYRPTTG